MIIIETSKTQGHKKDVLIFAKRAVQAPSSDGNLQLDLQEGRRYELSPDSKSYNKIGFKTYRVRLDIKHDAVYSVRVEGKGTFELLRQNNLESVSELGYRMSLPWMIWIALLMALPLSRVSPRQGRWLKLVPSILLYIVAVLVIISIKEPVAKGKIGIWAYPVVLVLMLILAIYVNYHSRLVMKQRLTRVHSLPIKDAP